MPHVEVNGVKIYYELHGPDDAPVLVLNNGIIMNAATSWIFQTKQHLVQVLYTQMLVMRTILA